MDHYEAGYQILTLDAYSFDAQQGIMQYSESANIFTPEFAEYVDLVESGQFLGVGNFWDLMENLSRYFGENTINGPPNHKHQLFKLYELIVTGPLPEHEAASIAWRAALLTMVDVDLMYPDGMIRNEEPCPQCAATQESKARSRAHNSLMVWGGTTIGAVAIVGSGSTPLGLATLGVGTMWTIMSSNLTEDFIEERCEHMMHHNRDGNRMWEMGGEFHQLGNGGWWDPIYGYTPPLP